MVAAAPLLIAGATATTSPSASALPSGLAYAITTDPFLDLVTVFLVVATSILAFKTWQLHAATVDLATDTVKATAVSDRHHQETLSPICVVSSIQSGQTGVNSYLKVVVANVGSGAALDISVAAVPVLGDVVYTSNERKVDCAPLPPGSVSTLQVLGDFPPPSDSLRVRISFRNQFDAEGFSESLIDVRASKFALKTLQLCEPQKRSL